VRAARRDARWALVLATCLASACSTDVVQLMSTSSSAPRPPCVSIPESGGGPLCVYCGANYSQQQACLKCGTTPSTSACASCIWSDAVDGGSCQQCIDSTGKVSYVGCNELRSDLTPAAP
jgi:hypothetical protein